MNEYIKKDYSISGMTCGACEKLVTKKLRTIPGVEEVNAFSQTGKVTVSSIKEVDPKDIIHALEGTHYTFINHS